MIHYAMVFDNFKCNLTALYIGETIWLDREKRDLEREREWVRGMKIASPEILKWVAKYARAFKFEISFQDQMPPSLNSRCALNAESSRYFSTVYESSFQNRISILLKKKKLSLKRFFTVADSLILYFYIAKKEFFFKYVIGIY